MSAEVFEEDGEPDTRTDREKYQDELDELLEKARINLEGWSE